MKSLLLLFLLLFITTDCIPCKIPLNPRNTQLSVYTDIQGVKDPGRTITIRIDQDFTPTDRVVIEEAVSKWQYVLNGYVLLKVIKQPFGAGKADLSDALHENGWVIVQLMSTSPVLKMEDPATVARVDTLGGNFVFVIRDRMQDDWLFGVMLHEMGHLLGARHHHWGLMTPHFSANYYRCVDQDTAKQVAFANFIPEDKVNFCFFNKR